MRRRQIFAQRSRSALDPSGAAGSGPAPTTPPAPVSREEEEKQALIWRGTYEHPIGDPRNEVGWEVTPATDPTGNAPKRKTLRLKRGRHAD
jgi:hypothetical protein